MKLRSSGAWSFGIVAWMVLMPLRESVADSAGMIPPQMLERLAKEYRYAGLPLPPSGAPLMRVFTGIWEQEGESPLTPRYTLGYRLKDADGKASHGTFLVGTAIFEPDPDAESTGAGVKVPEDEVFDPQQPLPAGLTAEWPQQGKFPVDNWLVIAIQSYVRGDCALVQRIFEQGLAGHETFGVGLPAHFGRSGALLADNPLGDSLSLTAWNYWLNELVRPGSDRRAILGRLEELAAHYRILNNPSQRAFLASIRRTLRPKTSAPGTVEALIVSLTECSMDRTLDSAPPPPGSDYDRLQILGFQAVPALIAHLNDQRLTRSVTVGFNNFPTRMRCVGEVVSDLIEGLAAPELGGDWLSRQQGYPDEVSAVRHWWRRAKAMGEEAYVSSNVFPAKMHENDALNATCLRIVAARYPPQLGKIYTRLLQERPDLDSQDLVDTIAASDRLSQEEKLRLLRFGVEQPALGRREDALFALQKLDPGDVEAQIVKELDRLPADSEQPYSRCSEARIVYLVTATSTPDVWRAFTQAAKRAQVGLRMQLMDALGDAHVVAMQRKQTLAFLAAFLDDETVRVITGEKYEGWPAASMFPNIRVRDFAAMKIAQILGLPIAPRKDWSEARWEEYHANVCAALSAQ